MINAYSYLRLRSGLSRHRSLKIVILLLYIGLQSLPASLYASFEPSGTLIYPPVAMRTTADTQQSMAIPVAFLGVWGGEITVGTDSTFEVLMTLTSGTTDSVVGMIAFNNTQGGCVEAMRLQAVNNATIDLTTDLTSGTYFGTCISSDYRLTLNADGTLFYEEFINEMQRGTANLIRLNAADTALHAALSGIWRGAVIIGDNSIPILLALANGRSGTIAGTIAFDGDTLCIEEIVLQNTTSSAADLVTGTFAGSCVPSLYKLQINADGTLAYQSFIDSNQSSTGTLINIGVSFSISGRITDNNAVPLADVIIYTDTGEIAFSARDGTYTLDGLAPGRYTISPFKSGHSFNPEFLIVDLPPDNTRQDFTTKHDPVRVIDVTVSLYDNPVTPAERDPYVQALNFFADGVFEASNGAHKLGHITVYTAGAFADRSHIVWDTRQCRAYATVSGYGREQAGLHVRMCGHPGWRSYEAAGYTLAHEWGHYYYSLYDEYREVGWPCDYFLSPGKPCDDDMPVRESIMHNQYNAVGGDYTWLNFSTTRNSTRNTAQYRVYGASAWETLVRPPAMDPRSNILRAYPERFYYPELAEVAPAPGQAPRIDLTLNHTARSNLSIVWDGTSLNTGSESDYSHAMIQTNSGSIVPVAMTNQLSSGTVHQVVIDISAGMVADNKLENVKRAVQWLVDQMVPGSDAIAIMTFDDEVTVVQPVTFLDSEETRDIIKARIEAIQPGRIDAAIGEAINQALQDVVPFSHHANATTPQVYLITGSASRKGSSPLVSLIEYTNVGIPLHTIAYGLEPNTARLLQVLSSETSGTYHFISPPTNSDNDASLVELIQAFVDIQQITTPAVTTDITIGHTFIPASATVTLPIIVDSTLDTLDITLTYDTTTPAELQLFDPDGNFANVATCVATGINTRCSIQVRPPALRTGSWLLQATALTSPVELTYRATGTVYGKSTFIASLETLAGTTVTYPDPLVVRAILKKDLPIAQAVVTATITLPDGNVQPLLLHDDGIVPDVLADDGTYSAILDYTQNGVYAITVQFDNNTGSAEETNRGIAFAPDDGETAIPDPTPVGENFMRAATLRVQVTGVRADDHGDTPHEATQLFSDNTDIPGRIDWPGDKDVFRLMPTDNGHIALRISSLALGMEPRLRLFAADGVTMLENIEYVSDQPGYIYTIRRVKAGDILYAEVSHLDETAVGGRYTISAGPALTNESLPWPWFLIGTITSGLALMGIFSTYLISRRARSFTATDADNASLPEITSTQPIRQPKPPTSPDTESGASTKD